MINTIYSGVTEDLLFDLCVFKGSIVGGNVL